MAAQVSQLTQFILARRDWALVDVYMDFDSASGSKMRDNFYRMIDDAKAGRLDYIVTKSIQRFGRNTEENLTAMRTLLDSGVVVYFQIEGFASNDPEAELEAALFSTLAGADNASRREDRLWGRQRRIENGTSGLFRRPCYGYTLADNGVLVIDKNKADVVRKIYDSYLSGMSISGIKKMLEEEKIPSPSGGKTWAARTIDLILSNEKYYGTIILFKTITINYPYTVRKDNRDASLHDQYCMTNGVSAIISEEEFKAVQEEKKRRNPYDENGNRKPQKYSSKKLLYLSTNSKENGNIVDNNSTELPGSD